MKTGPQPSEEFRVITQFSGVLNSIFAVGWTVWSLIPGGASFTVPVRADIGVHPASVTLCTGSLSRG